MEGTSWASWVKYTLPVASSKFLFSLSCSSTVTKSTGSPRVNMSSIAP